MSPSTPFSQGDAVRMLEQARVDPTPHRVEVLLLLARESSTLSAPELLQRLAGIMNKVTLYRTLDLLVDKQLIFRHSAGDRTFRYCFGTPEHNPTHIHFYCTSCNTMQCLSRDQAPLDLAAISPNLPHHIHNVELRFDGTCEACGKKGNLGG